VQETTQQQQHLQHRLVLVLAAAQFWLPAAA
jgi:hypothetical protein